MFATMQTENSYPDFEIGLLQTKKWPTPSPDCFLQIVHVLSGSGKYHEEEEKYDFAKGDSFLIIPGQNTSVSLKDEGEFMVIDFSNIYTTKKDLLKGRRPNAGQLYRPLEYLYVNYEYAMVSSENAKKANESLTSLFDELQKENKSKNKDHDIIRKTVVKIVTTFSKTVQKKLRSSNQTTDDSGLTTDIIEYIHENIYDVYNVRVEFLAKEFGRAKDYLGFYFKTHTGHSLKDYMTYYKFELITLRLKYSNKTILEIVHEFGFTDESHMNRIFKNLYGDTAKRYQQAHLEERNK